MLPSRSGVLAEATNTLIKAFSSVFFLSIYNILSQHMMDKKVTNNKQKVKSNEQRAKANEQRAKSKG